MTLAWGARVSPLFRDKVRAIGEDVRIAANDIMSGIAWESGRSFRPDVRNMAGSGATGLLQFMPAIALTFFHTGAEIRAMSAAEAHAAGLAACERLAAMTAEAQLDYVGKYLAPYRGRLHDLADLYMAILWPVAIGKPGDFVLFEKDDPNHPARYRQNAGLDTNADGHVTKTEAAARVVAIRAEGLRPINAAD